MYTTKLKRRSTSHRRRYIILAVLLLIVIAVACGLFFTKHRGQSNQRSGNKTATPTAIQKDTSVINQAAPQTSGTPGSESGTSAKAPDTPRTNGTSPPKAPSTDGLVSNHRPKLNDQWGTNKETSVCNTSPGANCEISFSKDSIIKSLGKKQTDANGSAYWEWTLQNVGLTAGTWTVTATATLNNQTASASDPIKLEVQ